MLGLLDASQSQPKVTKRNEIKMKRKRLFVIDLENHTDPIHAAILRDTEDYTLHELQIPKEAMRNAMDNRNRVQAFLKSTQNMLARLPEKADGIIGYDEYPISTIVPILNEQCGLNLLSSNSLLRCEHKYWSRLEQKQCIPEHTPDFCLFDPFDAESYNSIQLEFPFWMKPVKAFSSFLGFKIKNKHDFQKAIAIVQKTICSFTNSFDEIVKHMNVDIPDQIASVPGHYYLAEELVGGHQCTLEGFVFDGEVYTYGIVDSIRYPNHSSFFRYQYPSALPKQVKLRMEHIAKKFLSHINYNNSAFNIEFFWNKRKDKIYLLEVNPRIAPDHGSLFQSVDGLSNYQIPIDIALRKKPEMPYREGGCKVAASCYYRTFEDAFVQAIPDTESVKAIEELIPQTHISIQAKPGQYLSALPIYLRDSYSYAYTMIYIGAQDQPSLLENYRKSISELLPKFKLMRGTTGKIISGEGLLSTDIEKLTMKNNPFPCG